MKDNDIILNRLHKKLKLLDAVGVLVYLAMGYGVYLFVNAFTTIERDKEYAIKYILSLETSGYLGIGIIIAGFIAISIIIQAIKEVKHNIYFLSKEDTN